jgi:hypothetical protein
MDITYQNTFGIVLLTEQSDIVNNLVQTSSLLECLTYLLLHLSKFIHIGAADFTPHCSDPRDILTLVYIMVRGQVMGGGGAGKFMSYRVIW